MVVKIRYVNLISFVVFVKRQPTDPNFRRRFVNVLNGLANVETAFWVPNGQKLVSEKNYFSCEPTTIGKFGNKSIQICLSRELEI